MAGVRGGLPTVLLLLVALTPLGGYTAGATHEAGAPDLIITDTVTPHAGCTTIDLTAELAAAGLTIADVAGEPFWVATPLKQPGSNQKSPMSDFVVTFEHPTNIRPVTQAGPTSDLKGFNGVTRTVVDKLTGGGSDVIAANIHEFGTVPAGTETVTICMKETLSSYKRIYIARFIGQWVQPLSFELKIGGALPPAFTLVETDVPAFPLTDNWVTPPMHGRSFPADVGTVTMPVPVGYETVMAQFEVHTGQGDEAWLWLCEDANGNGACDPGEPFKVGCVGVHYMDSGKLEMSVSGHGHNVLMAVTTGAAAPIGNCGPEEVLDLSHEPSVDMHGGAVHAMEGIGVYHGDAWLSVCDPHIFDCEAYKPTDVAQAHGHDH